MTMMLCGCYSKSITIKVMYGVHSIAYSSEEEQSKPYLEAVERLNETLRKKKLPYKVEMDFVMINDLSIQDDLDKMYYYEVLDEVIAQETYDLIYLPVSGRSRLTLQDVINKGYVECLDAYFKSEIGEEVLNAYPKNIIDAIKVNGSSYLLPVNINQSALLDNHYYTYDQSVLSYLNLAIDSKVQLWDVTEEIIAKYLQEDTHRYGLVGIPGKLFAYQNGYTSVEGNTILDTPFVLNETNHQIECILDVKDFQAKVNKIKKMNEVQKQYLMLSETGGYLFYLDEQNRPIQVNTFFINGIETNHPINVSFDKQYSMFAYGGIGVASTCKQKEDAYAFLHLLATDKDVNNALKSNGEIQTLGNLFQSDFSEIQGLELPYNNQDSLFTYIESLPISKVAGFSFDSSKVSKAYQDIMVYYLDFDSQQLEDTLRHFDFAERDVYTELGMDEVLAEMNRQYQLYLKN